MIDDSLLKKSLDEIAKGTETIMSGAILFNNGYQLLKKSIDSIGENIEAVGNIELTRPNVTILTKTSTSFRLRAEYADFVSLYVEYGTDINYGSQTTKEESFDYSTHEQEITGLEPKTIYHYRLVAADSDGEIYLSQDYTETTDAAPVTVVTESSPAPNRMTSGNYLGYAQCGGYGAANSAVNNHQAIKFIAQRTATSLTGFENQYRALRLQDYTSRGAVGSTYQNNELYRLCLEQDTIDLNTRLGRAQCSYVVKNAYSAGSGGQYIIELRKVLSDGGPDLSASGLIGAASQQYSPFDYPEESWPKVPLDNMPVTYGETYFLLFKNLKPPSIDWRDGLSVAQAAAVNTAEGYMSFNGLYVNNSSSNAVRSGPVFDFNNHQVWHSYDGVTYTRDFKTIAWHVLEYDSNVREGFTPWAADNWILSRTATESSTSTDNNVQTIQGSKRGRQRIVPKEDFTTNKVHVFTGYTINANSTPLIVQLKNSSGTVLGTASLSPDTNVQNIRATGTSIYAFNAQGSVSANLNNDVTMVTGQTYYAEISSASGGGFRVPSFQTKRGSTSTYLSSEHVGVTDVAETGDKAQVSYNNGSSWTVYPRSTSRGNNHSERYLPIIFERKFGT